ncbi:hypothetical protein C7402_10638 [Paraburkholderia unamae]|uniref:Uncharacterized protein n=1 Tax=Paraburkholderia unamae TaxID=219649 RepID=A0ABX5KQ72_9BURK|nr:hypothetical protein C7402_10638 [Paraburkholderia unamae]RAR63781.1 hypothetical protein C7401_10538 [Paraburkholderia unamae]
MLLGYDDIGCELKKSKRNTPDCLLFACHVALPQVRIRCEGEYPASAHACNYPVSVRRRV